MGGFEIKNYSVDELHSRTLEVAVREQRMTLELLHHLMEVRRKRVFAVKGYPSLWEYVHQYLRYSEAATNERVRAMELLEGVPGVQDRIEAGELNLTTASKVQIFARRLEKKEGRKLSVVEKSELVEAAAGKSKRQVDQLFAEIAPELAVPAERVRPVNSELTQISLVVDAETLQMLERFQELRGRQGHSEILKTVLRDYLKRKDPEVAAVTPNPQPAVDSTPPKPTSRYIPAPIKRTLWKRAGSQCEFVDRKTGKRCTARHYLQIDHIEPWSVGGSSTKLGNLRLTCAVHNQLYAVRFFGERKMREWKEYRR